MDSRARKQSPHYSTGKFTVPKITPNYLHIYDLLACCFTFAITHSQREDTRSWKISKVHTTWRPPPHPSRATFAPVGSERIFTRLSCCPCFLPDTLPYRKRSEPNPPLKTEPTVTVTKHRRNREHFKGPELAKRSCQLGTPN